MLNKIPIKREDFETDLNYKIIIECSKMFE